MEFASNYWNAISQWAKYLYFTGIRSTVSITTSLLILGVVTFLGIVRGIPLIVHSFIVTETRGSRAVASISGADSTKNLMAIIKENFSLVGLPWVPPQLSVKEKQC